MFLNHLIERLEKEHTDNHKDRLTKLNHMMQLFAEVFVEKQQEMISNINALQLQICELINDAQHKSPDLQPEQSNSVLDQFHDLQQQQMSQLQELHNLQTIYQEGHHHRQIQFQQEDLENHQFRMGFLREYYLKDFDEPFQVQLRVLETEHQNLKQQSEEMPNWYYVSRLIDKCYDERAALLSNNIKELKNLQATLLQELRQYVSDDPLESILNRHIGQHSGLCARQQNEIFALQNTPDQRELMDISMLSLLCHAI